MTLIDRYLTLTAKEVEKTDADAQRSIVTTLEQRIACALAEARAIECKHMATEFRIKIANPPRILIDLANSMDERARKLTKKSLDMARNYPPADTEPEPEQKRMVTLQ